MEGLQSVPNLEATSAPAPAPAPAPVVESAPAPSNEGALEKVANSQLDLKTVLLIGLLSAMAIYSIIASKKILEEQEGERVKAEEFDALGDEIDELKMNLKKAMGAKYQTLKK
jgi:3-oxoacyl-ACP reductase-like protein